MRGADAIEIVTPGAVSLDEGVRAALARGRARIVVDLHEADSLDAGALRTLVLATHAAQAHGGCLVVLCPASPARATLRATGLDGHLTVAGTRARAIRAARRAA
jgi:anti-anti-sigma factor